MKPKIPKISVLEGTRTFLMSPIENYLHLQTMVSIQLRNRHIGAYLLKKSKSSPWKLVFGFVCQGIHSFLSSEEVNEVFDPQINAKRSVEAQESLYEGAVPFHTGIVFLVHRNTLEELDEASRQIENFFLRPAWVVRETEVAWQIWLQTLPIVEEKLLAFRYGNRRLVYLSKELPGLIPLITTLSPDLDGLELIGEDGGTPVHINFFRSEGKHLGVFGTTRSGKSVLVSGILTHALARNVPVVALDYPKPDGSSTFTDYTKFVSPLGQYFDVGAESINLFERPDLSALPFEEQKRRFEDYKDFLSGCLLAMVVGVGTEEIIKTTIRTIVYCILNNFFADEAILERYQRAEQGGIGTKTSLQSRNDAQFTNLNLANISDSIDQQNRQRQANSTVDSYSLLNLSAQSNLF